MPIVAKDEQKVFHLQPAGNQQAVCYDVWDIGIQEIEWKGEKKYQHKIIIGFELEERIASDDDMNGQKYKIHRRYTLSLGDKSNLAKDLTSWRGRAFTKEEKTGFDVEKLVGVNCMLSVIHGVSPFTGKELAKISAITALPKGLPKITSETPRSMPDWVKELQAKAKEPAAEPVEVVEEAAEEIPF